LATRKELAEHLDLSPQSISDLIGKGIFTISSGRSPVNIDVCRVQYINHIRKSARYTRKDGTGDIAEEKAKLTAAQARKAELEVEQLEKSLIPAQLVEDTWIDYVSNVRARLLGLPSRVAHQVITVDKYAEAELIIKEQVHEALNELAQNGIPKEYRKGDKGDESDMDSSAELKD
jgi:phage terminase Nu1 subunit (DNA packaging protein)